MTQHPAIVPGHVAVITGGASGIGLALAHRLGAAGMVVVLADLDEAALGEAVGGLRERGMEAVPVRTDVGDEAQVSALQARAAGLGPIGMLFNNAGREGGGGLLAGAAIWQDTLSTNLMGPVLGVQHFLPGMKAAAHPCAIVNTGSKQGITLPPGDTAYNVSKAGLKAMTELLAHDLLETDGRITAHLLIPGFTYTGFSRRRGMAEKPDDAWTADQVAEFALAGMARGNFYLLCPDNAVTRATDEKRMAWATGDIIENRPALSRWHPAHKAAFEAYMRGGSSQE